MRFVRFVGWLVVIGGALVAIVAFFANAAPGGASTSAIAIAIASLAVSVASFWLLRRSASPSGGDGGPDDWIYASDWTAERISNDPARRGRASPVADPFVDLPFEMLLPVGWRAGLAEDTSAEGLEIASEAVFLAHDPETSDSSGYMATMAVFVSEPVDDADAYLADQEREFRSGMETDASLASFDLSRVNLIIGEALRASFARDAVQVQYYLPTPRAVIELWFTAPVAARYPLEAAFEVMARSLRWKDGH